MSAPALFPRHIAVLILVLLACAFAGAVLLIILKVISADEAYSGLRPDILILIAGMVVLGIALEESGLAKSATTALVGSLDAKADTETISPQR